MIDFDKEKLEENIEIFIESSVDREDYSFNTGLLGGGWLLSFCHQHELLFGDIDDILSDFDDSFYKLAVRAVVDVNSSLVELLNLIHYFQQRIQNKPKKHDFYRRFALVESIKLLADKLAAILKSNTLSQFEEIEVVLKLSYLSQTCLPEKEIERVYYSKTEEIIENFRRLEIMSTHEQYYLRLLQLSCIQYENPYWVNEIENIFSSASENFESEMMIKLKEICNKLFNSPNVKLDLSNFMGTETKDFLRVLATNLKRIELIYH